MAAVRRLAAGRRPAGGGVVARSADGGAQDAGPSLSERLQLEQQQQNQQRTQQRHKGPLLDSDHSALSGSTASRPRSKPHNKSSGGSIQSGWSWDSSRQSEGWSWASSAKSGSSPVRGKYAPVGGKRNMKAVLGAFGGEGKIGEIVRTAMHCRSGRGEAGEQSAMKQQPSKGGAVARAVNIGVLMVLALFGVHRLGRRRGSQMESSASHSMSDMYLRGQLSSESSGADGNNGQKSHGDDTIVHKAYFPPHLGHLANVTKSYDATAETPYFWDVHFSGESVAEAVFANCHGLVQACEFGLRQPNYDEDKLGVFQLEGAEYVNVDLSTKEGIDRASRLSLASGNIADVIASPHFNDVASRIFTSSDQGRMFALFRHPVDRALGMYYYLQKASWDSQYNPQLAKMSLAEYAKSKYIESNWLTRFLVGKTRGKLTHADMLLAKKIVKFKCLVGLWDDLETSLARFSRYFGWEGASGERKAEVAKCQSEAVQRGDKHVLGHPISLKEGQEHLMPKSGSVSVVRAGSRAWDAIVRMNAFDMELYAYAKKIYGLQAEEIFDVVGHEVPARPADSEVGVAEDGVAGRGVDEQLAEDSSGDQASTGKNNMAAALELAEAKAAELNSNDGGEADLALEDESSDPDEAPAPDGVEAAVAEVEEESSDDVEAAALHPHDGSEAADPKVNEEPSDDEAAASRLGDGIDAADELESPTR